MFVNNYIINLNDIIKLTKIIKNMKLLLIKIIFLSKFILKCYMLLAYFYKYKFNINCKECITKGMNWCSDGVFLYIIF